MSEVNREIVLIVWLKRLFHHRPALRIKPFFLAISLLLLLMIPGCKSDYTIGDFPAVEVWIDGILVESDVPAIEIEGNVFIPAQMMNRILDASTVVSSTADVRVTTSAYNDLRLEISKTQAILEKAEQMQAAVLEDVSPAAQRSGVSLRAPYVISCSDYSEMQAVMAAFNVRGGRGGRLSYILQSLPTDVASIRTRDSVFLINISYEPLYALKAWPDAWSDILPFSYDELVSFQPPYVWTRRDNRGFLRAVVVVLGLGNVKPAVDLLVSGTVPIDTPLTPVTTLLAGIPERSDKVTAGIVKVSSEHFEVEVLDRYYAGDGPLFLEWASEAITRLQTVFTDALDKVPRVKVLLSEPSAQLPIGTASSTSVTDPPRMRFIYPSLSKNESRTYDRDWYIGNIAHEFMHCLHERYSMESTGLPLHSRQMPKWFTEGVCEYAKFLVVGKTLFSQESLEKTARDIIEYGLARVNVYDGGALAFLYMHEVYGPDKIISVLRSTESLFEDVLKAELGVTSVEFEEGLKEWLSRR